MVPLATPARRATSSSRVAANPWAANSSSAAARIASRRAALFSARPPARLLGGEACGFGPILSALALINTDWLVSQDMPASGRLQARCPAGDNGNPRRRIEFEHAPMSPLPTPTAPPTPNPPIREHVL